MTIYTIGDSTMASKKPEVYHETGWCQVLGNFFDEHVRISNHAVNGRSSKSFISEGRWKAVLDSLMPGDYVFIQFGHNDEKDYDTTRFTTPFGTYSDNLKKFIVESREKGAIPVLFTPIVRRKFDEAGKLTDTHGKYPDAARKVSNQMNVPMVDLQKLTAELIQSLGNEPSRNLYLWTGPDDRFPEGRKDDTHLSMEGALQVASLAAGELKKLHMKLSKLVKSKY